VDEQRERTLQQKELKRLMDQVAHDQSARSGEKKMLMLIGMLVLALVASVGLAMFMKAPKEQDLARSRCEMDQTVSLVWKETEAIKVTNPGINAREIQDRIEARRPEFKEAARAFCASK
jgi:hypothetical protein